MSNANPAKEPSMDEILASIRRIIESSDDRSGIAGALRPANQKRSHFPDAQEAVTRQPQTQADAERLAALVSRAAAARAPYVEPHGAAVDSGEASVPSIVESETPFAPRLADAGRHPVRALSRAVPAPPGSASMPDGLTADDASARSAQEQARLGAASGDAEVSASVASRHALAEPRPAAPDPAQHSLSGALREAPTFVPVVADEFAEDGQDIEFSLDFDEESFAAELRGKAGLIDEDEAALAAALIEEADARPQAASDLARERVVVSDAGRPDRFPEFLATLDQSDRPAGSQTPAGAPSSMISQTSALISEQAGEQVAAAFDDLSRAIRDGQMRSMEDMAREMLRPMLHEWLDDNLPRLVERMVREEIERVSRGGGGRR